MTAIRPIWILAVLCMAGSALLAQTPEPQQPQQPQQQQGGVIEIEAQVLDARVELPQVQILDRRKQADFDEVKVEKSFSSELSGKTEELRFTPNTSGRIKPIENIEVYLKKRRF